MQLLEEDPKILNKLGLKPGFPEDDFIVKNDELITIIEVEINRL